MNMPLLQGRKPLLILAGLATALLGILIYLPGLSGDFVFDDIGSIAQNPALRPDHGGNLLQVLLSAPVGGLLRPISTLSFVLDAAWFGISPAAFKLTNIFIHIAAGAMLFLVAREILRAHTRHEHAAATGTTDDWLALAATAIWLVHPINLTSVLYVVQRDNSLAALFSAGAIYAYLTGRRREIEGGGGVALMFVATPLLVLLGMLCKENAALTPVLLLVAEFTLLRFEGRDGAPSRRCRWFFLLFLALPVAALCVFMALRPAFFLAAYDVRPFTMYQRVLTECGVLVDYLRWIVVPDLRQLGLFHDDIAASRSLLDPPSTLFAVLAVSGLVAGACVLRRRFPLLALGILWFFGAHLLESSILPLELFFEHRNYMPSFGLVFGVVGTLYPVGGEVSHQRLVRLGLAAVLALMALTTAVRAHDWRSELAFARSESLHHPDSARATAELEWSYMNYIVASHDTSLIPAAVRAAERSKAADPGSVNQDIGLAYMYVQLEDMPSAQTRLRMAAARGSHGAATASLQLALQSLLQMTDQAEKPLYGEMDALFRSVLSNPQVARNACYHSEVWNTYAIFLSDTEMVQGSLEAFHKAVSLCPSLQLIHANFADMLLRFGDSKDAKAEIDALDAQHDIRYLAESRRLHEEYARVQATH